MITTSQYKVSMTSSRYARGRRLHTPSVWTEKNLYATFRFVVTVALLLCLPTLAVAQTGTSMPTAVHQFFDNNGDPLSGCKLYTYAAGTSTPLNTYTDATLGVANANPVVCDAAGRLTAFLSPTSYKLVLKTSADVTVWSADNVSAIPLAEVEMDVSGTAGETLTAGQVAVMSDGTSSTTAGRWYKADADATYTSTGATAVGIVQTSAAAGATTSVRLQGRVTGLSGLTAGTTYFVSATAGALTGTAPANAMRVGVAESSTVLLLTPQGVSTNDRLSMTSPTIAAGALSGTFSGTPTFSGAIVFSGTPSVNAGLAFPATQAASGGANTLDDYEEGDWTPTIGGSGGASGVTYGSQVGKYIKIGKLVHAWFDITLTAEGTITGTAQIQSLPPSGVTVETAFGSCNIGYFANMGASVGFIGALLDAGANTATLYYSAAAAGSVAAVDQAITSNTTRLSGVCTYRTSS
jgi:hypothetical protein